jgi:hypothetical protein
LLTPLLLRRWRGRCRRSCGGLPQLLEAVSPFCLLLFARGGISGTSGVFWVVDGGSRGLLFRSSALRAMAADVPFLFLLRGDVGRWSFSIYDSSCRVGKAMAFAARPMFGVASQYGSWICSETGSRRRRAGAPATTCSLKDCVYLVVFYFSFRVLFEKSRGVFVMPLFHPFNIFPFLTKGIRRSDTLPLTTKMKPRLISGGGGRIQGCA